MRPQGFSIIEITLAIALFVLTAPAVALLTWGALKSENAEKLQALTLAEEGLEAARSIRENSWEALTAGPHGLTDSNGYWEFNGTSQAIGNFTRQITIADIDSDRKEITANAQWGSGRSVTLVTRLTNWQRPAFVGWTQTTLMDFMAGDLEDTVLRNQNGGEVTLAENVDEGHFTSSAFNTGVADPDYQTLNWVFSGGGDLKFQIHTSNSESGLSSAVWVGPGGVQGTYYTVSGAPLVPHEGGTRWIQYRAYFEEIDGQIPTLEQVTVQYTP